MAKKEKFALEMRGVEVRTIEELKENYYAKAILEYFHSGKLLTWLNDRYYDEEAEQVEELDKDLPDKELTVKLREIFEVEDPETAERRRARLEKLSEFTNDKEFTDNIDLVAFSQEELGELLDDETDTVYLCGESFRIPLSVENVRYIGVNSPVITIKCRGTIDLSEKGIAIERCTFDEGTKAKLGDSGSAAIPVKEEAPAKADKDIINISADDIEYTSEDEFEFSGGEDGEHIIVRYVGTSPIVKIPKEVWRISEYAFAKCDTLERVIIPEGVERIRDGAFYMCKNLRRVDLPDSIETICSTAFSGCSKLETINIPDEIFNIETCAFLGCKRLKGLVIPEDIGCIGQNAFKGCPKDAITFPQKEFDEEYVENCDEIYKENDFDKFDICISANGDNEYVYLSKYFGSESNVEIPDYVCYIGDDAFDGCENLVHVSIPDRVIGIGTSAFRNCRNLEEIELPDGVTKIDWFAFQNCEHLAEINIPDSVEEIGNNAFENCKSLCSIELPDGIEDISDSLFSGCENLEDITIPDSVTTVWYNAFKGCERIESIELPNVDFLYDSAFEGCINLRSVYIPKISIIFEKTFMNCENLEKIKASDDECCSIEKMAFYGCISLKNLKGLNLGCTIAEEAFAGCENLTSANFSEVYEVKSKAFAGCKHLTNADLSNASKIESKAFADCESLTNVSLSEAREIESNAFAGCTSLKTVTVSEEYLSEIGNDAFKDCFNIRIRFRDKTFTYNNINSLYGEYDPTEWVINHWT